MEPSDHELLRKLVRGHAASADAFWRRHAPRLRMYAVCVLRRAEGADDVVQGVFCRLLELKHSTIDQVRDVPAWLTSLTRRAAINHLRSTRREQRRIAAVGVRSGGHAAPLRAATRAVGLEQAFETLPRRLGEIVTLRHVVGLTFEQIAIATGVNRNTVASRHAAALRRLQSMMSADAPGLRRDESEVKYV
jgi:RNA polymerase sigma factor (sigma-70 family)